MPFGGGGGDQSVRLDLPNWYIERLRGQVLPQIDALYAERAQNPLNQTQEEALAGMEEMARAGNPLADQGVNALSRLFENRGLPPAVQQLGQGLTQGAFQNPGMRRAQDIARGGYTNDALSEATRLAGGNYTNPSTRRAQRIGERIAAGETNATFDRAQDIAGGIAGGQTNRTFADAQGMSGRLAGGEFGNDALAETRRLAMGGEVGSNPFLDAAYGKAAREVTRNFNDVLVPGMDRSFMESGRLGSGAYAKLRNTAEQQTGQALGDLATDIYGGAYETDQGRRMQALGQYGQLGQEGIQNRLAGTQLQGQLGQAEMQQQLAGAELMGELGGQQMQERRAGTELLGNLGNQQLQARMQGAGLLGQIGQQGVQNELAGAGLIGQLGQQNIQNRLAGAGLLDQGTQRMLQGIGLGGQANDMRYGDLSRLYGIGQQRQQAPWDAASQYMGLLTATPGLGSGQSMSGGGGNPFGDILGGALGLGSLGLMIGGPQGLFPGAMAAMSDRRVKKDIKRVGETDAGTPIYTFKYRGTEGPTQMGVMAQDALKSKKNRKAVGVAPDGKTYTVLYDLVK